MTMVDRLCWRVAATSEAKAEDTSQAAPRATVHLMLKEGTDTTLCGKLEALDTSRVNVLRVVSCPDCNKELKKIRQRNSRDGHARMVERKRQEQQESEQQMASDYALEQMRLKRDSETLRKLRECCGFVENGSEQTVRIFQDDATRGWIVKCGDERMISSVPAAYSKPRSYHGNSLDEAIDTAYRAEKQEN